MKRDDIGLLREVQRKAKLMDKELEQLGNMAEEKEAIQLHKERLKISALHDKALEQMLGQDIKPYGVGGLEEGRQKTRILRNTIFNSSMKKLAHLLIQDNMKDMADMWSVMGKYENASKMSMEIAKELVDFEENMIRNLKEKL